MTAAVGALLLLRVGIDMRGRGLEEITEAEEAAIAVPG